MGLLDMPFLFDNRPKKVLDILIVLLLLPQQKSIKNERESFQETLYSIVRRGGCKRCFARRNDCFDAFGSTIFGGLGIHPRGKQPHSRIGRRVDICYQHLFDVSLLHPLSRHAARIETQGGISYPRPYNDLLRHCRLLYSDCSLRNWRLARGAYRCYSVAYGAVRHILQIALEAFNTIGQPHDIFDYGLDDCDIFPSVLEECLYPSFGSDWRRRNLLHYRCVVLCQEGISLSSPRMALADKPGGHLPLCRHCVFLVLNKKRPQNGNLQSLRGLTSTLN